MLGQRVLFPRRAHDGGRVVGQQILADEVAREGPERSQATARRRATVAALVERREESPDAVGVEAVDGELARPSPIARGQELEALRQVGLVRPQRVRRRVTVVAEVLEERAKLLAQ
jgi:hypothetical protein